MLDYLLHLCQHVHAVPVVGISVYDVFIVAHLVFQRCRHEERLVAALARCHGVDAVEYCLCFFCGSIDNEDHVEEILWKVRALVEWKGAVK